MHEQGQPSSSGHGGPDHCRVLGNYIRWVCGSAAKIERSKSNDKVRMIVLEPKGIWTRYSSSYHYGSWTNLGKKLCPKLLHV